MFHRPLLTAGMIYFGVCGSFAQYFIILERGDTIPAKEYYTKGDSLGFPGGRVGKRDVLYMSTAKQVFQFPIPGMGLTTTKLEETDPVCYRAELFATKYAKADLTSIDVFDPMTDSLAMEHWDDCYRTQLRKLGVVLVVELSPLDHVASAEDITSPVTLVITRSGDTLLADRGLNSTKGEVHFIGGASIPSTDVLLIINPYGQHVMNARTGLRSKLRPQVNALSPAALGLIYARIYWDSVSTITEIPGLDKALSDNPDFSETFYKQQVRSQKRKDTVRTISTVGAVLKGGTR